MKIERPLLVAAVCSFAFPLIVLFVQNSSVGYSAPSGISERITSLTTSMNLHREGQATVTEDLTYDFINYARTGIQRVFPRWENLGGYFSRERAVTLLEIQRNGTPEPTEQVVTPQYIALKTGTQEVPVTGVQEYRLRYQLENAIVRTASGTEQLTVRVTGPALHAPIDTNSFKLHSPVVPMEATCEIQSLQGQRTNYCQSTDPGLLTTFQAVRWLEPNESMVIIATYPAGTFLFPLSTKPVPLVPVWVWIILFHLSFIGLIWFIVGRDSKGRGVVIPNEELMADIKPYEAGAILAQGATYASFMGLILDLARRGIIRFQRYDGSESMTLTVERANTSLPIDPLEKDVLHRLMMYTIQNNPKDEEETESASFGLYSEQSKRAYRLFEGRVSEQLATRGWFSMNPRALQVYSLVIFSNWSYGVYLLIQYRILDPHLNWMLWQIPLALPLFYFIPRLTREGALARERVKGLARYIEVAEKARLDYHETPQRSREKKDDLLPYAVALNIQKDWKKYFLKGWADLKKEKEQS